MQTTKGRRINLAVLIKPPVINHQGKIMINSRVIIRINNQRSIETTGDLFPAHIVRMIPICTRFTQRHLIDKIFARSNRCLRQVGNAIHLIDIADAMPMHRCWHGQMICLLYTSPSPRD